MAALIGVSISVVANGLKFAFTSYVPESDEWIAYACFGAFPFIVLSLARMFHWSTWGVAGLCTLLAWSTYLFYGIPQLASRGWIDMDLGFLIGTSPVWIAIAGMVASLFAPSRT